MKDFLMTALCDVSVVMLPGMHGTGDFMPDVVARILTHRPVLAFSYPNDTPMGYAALTAHFMAMMPATPFVILGESFAGPIAIEIAATNPNVRGLVLASSFCRNPWPRAFSPVAQRVGMDVLPRRLLEAILFGFDASTEHCARLEGILARVPQDVLRRRIIEVLQVDQRALLAKVACPILCLHGKSDWLVQARSVREVQRIQPGARIMWLDAAHVLLATQAEAAAAEIERFCEGVAAV
jgi:pimeloyl-[acyl-carrier protein] methyl ester esterase